MSFVSPPVGARQQQVWVDAGRLVTWVRPGQRRTIVLLHGNTSSKEAFRQLFYCEQLAAHALVALDLPGAGESEDALRPDEHYTIPSMASTVIRAISLLAVDEPLILGWSLGGHIAIEAIAQGLNAKALVLTGTPPCGPGASELDESFNVDETFAAGTSLAPEPALLDAYIAAVFGCPLTRLPETLLAQSRRFDGRLRATLVRHWLEGSAGHHQRSVVARWPKPIAAINGSDDPFSDPKIIDRLEWRNLWRGYGQIIANAGHAPFFSHPDAYAKTLHDFLVELD